MDIFVDGKLVKTLWLDGQSWKRPIAPPEGLSGHYVAMMNQNEAYDPVKLAWARTGDSAPSCRFQIWDLEVEENGWTEMEFGRQYISQKGFAVRGVGNQKTAASDTVYNYFNLYNGQGAADVRLSGDILAVLDKTPPAVLGQFAVNGLFRNQGNVADVMGLSCSPAAISSDHALQFLFYGSSVQETPFWPGLSCTQASEYEYGENFLDCTQLKTARIQLPWVADGVDHSANEGPAFQQFASNDGIMSAYVKSHFGDGRVQGDSLPKLIGYSLFYNCSNLSCVSTDIASWGQDNFASWLEGCAVSGQFWCPSALGVDSTISRGINRAPEGWLVGNPDVEGEDAANFVIRDASVTSQADQAPDFSAVQVWNAQTLQKLTLSVDWVPVYQTHSEPSAYTWSISGIGSYHGSLTGLPYDVVNNYVAFEALQANSSVRMTRYGAAPQISVEYSLDGQTWSPMAVNEAVTLAAVGDVCYVRGVGNEHWSTGDDNNGSRLLAEGRVKVSGLITTLLDKDAKEISAQGAFHELFYGSSGLADARELVLPPQDVIPRRGYSGMFRECQQLTALPERLPGRRVASGGYQAMCHESRALSDLSYIQIDATECGSEAFGWFIDGDSQLRATPWMHAVPSAGSYSCYEQAFSRCSRLSRISCDFTSWNGIGSWASSVSSFGFLHCPSALGLDETIQRGGSSCPANWVVANFDYDPVSAADASTFVVRGSYTTAFMADGQAHVPDVSNMQMYDRRTGSLLAYGTDWTASTPPGQDNTTAGQKVLTVYGAGSYTGVKELQYQIVVPSIADCQITAGASWDGEAPPLTVYQPTLQQYLTPGTDYLMSYETVGGVCDVSLTGTGTYTGTTQLTTTISASGNNPVTFTGLSSSNTLRLSRYGSPPAASFQYKLGSGSWTDLPENTNVAVAENQTMQVRAKGGEQRMGSSLNNFRWFQMTGRFKAAGNVMSLLDRSEQLTSVDNYAFANTFSKGHENYSVVSTLVDAKDLVLPAPRIRDSGYRGMFRGQALLSAVANVSALTADQYAFNSMYEACYGLLDVPAFQAVQANGTHTWSYMFINCRSLTGVPEEMFPESLNGTQICQEAFRNCSSLTKTPRLNAKKVTGSMAMQGMFQGCSNLSNIQTDMTAWTNQNNWVNGVAANGIFTCPSALGTNETIQRGVNRCPQNWQVVNWESMLNAVRFTAAAGGAAVGISAYEAGETAPSISMLSSTDGLTWGDYAVGGSIQLQGGETAFFKAKTTNTKMGKDWGGANVFFVRNGQASVEGPLASLLGQEPAALPDYCFYALFQNCSGLVDASGLEFPDSQLTNDNCYTDMFRNCASLSAVPAGKLPGGDGMGASTYQGMFYGCTALSDATALKLSPASGANCFVSMFEGCSALTAVSRVPVPAAGTDTRIMVNMFSGCSSLAQLSVDFKVWPSNTTDWLNGVSANGTFYCYDDLGIDQTIQRGASYCPAGWTVQNPPPVDYVPYVNVYGAKLDTGFVPTATMSFRTVISTGLESTDSAVVGNGANNEDTTRLFYSSGWGWMFDLGKYTNRAQANISQPNPGVFDISCWNLGLDLSASNGTTIQDLHNPATTGVVFPQATLSVNTMNSGSTRNFNISCLQIYDDGTLAKDFRAARDPDGTACMWDKVSQQYFYPQAGQYYPGSQWTAVDITILSGLTVQDGQYFDTGYKPNQNTRVVMSVDVQHSLEHWFGCWDVAYNNGAFAMGNDNSNVYVGYDGQGGGQGPSPVTNGPHQVELDKNVAKVDGNVLATFDAASFQTNYNLYLYAQNRSGTRYAPNGGVVYSCKIYDNDVLIRDFAPAEFGGVSGLYDQVAGVFYTPLT